MRPHLVDAPSEFLFPGDGSGPKRSSLLSQQIADMVEEHIGVRLTAHQFRHFVGYIYLLEEPGGHEVIRQLLGHRSIETTLNFYAGMEIQRAIAHFDAFLDRMIAAPQARCRRRRR